MKEEGEEKKKLNKKNKDMKVLNEYSKVLTICEKRFFVNVIESACNFYITIKRADFENVSLNNKKYAKRDFSENVAIYSAICEVSEEAKTFLQSFSFESFQTILANNFADFENIAKAEAAAPESGRAAEESETAAEYQEAAAPESGEAAADLVKTAAAVAFGFIGIYLTFAIFGI